MPSLAVSATVQTGSTVSAGTSAAGLRPNNRTFSLTGVLGTAIQKGDVVALWGSNDGGRTFQPLRQGENDVVQLNFYNPEVVIDDACDTYATQRLAVGPNSTLSAVGFNGETVYINPSPAWVQGGNSGFAPLGILGTTDAVPFRIISEGKDIFDSDGVVTAIGNLNTGVAGSSLQLASGSGGGQWSVDSTGILQFSTASGAISIDTAGGAIGIGDAIAAAKNSTFGSNVGNSQTLVQAGTGGLSLRNNGVVWAWPVGDGAAGASITTNGAGSLGFSKGTDFKFCANASLTNGADQFVPLSGLATSLTATAPQNNAVQGTASLTKIQVSYVGDAANVAGQTITVQLLKNGVNVAGATTSGTATTAGTKAASATFAASAYVAGDLFTCKITPSAALTQPITSIAIAVS